MAQILEMLRSRMAARAESNAEVLVAAARRIAAGESVDTAAVETALVAEGKSVDAFEAMCELARRRQAWHAARDRGPAAIVQRDKLTRELDAARNEYEKLRLRWVETSGQLGQQIDALIAVVSASDDATAKLTAPENVPGVLAERIRAADADHTAALQNAEAVRRDLKEARSRVKDEAEWVVHKKQFNDQRASTLDDHERALARWERRVKELEAALPPAERAVAAALKTLQERRAAALKL